MFQLAAAIDHTIASFNDPILAATVLPHPEAFPRLLWIGIAITVALLPWLVRHEHTVGKSRRR